MLLAVDPGLRACGCALFDPSTKKLLRAELVRGAPRDLQGPQAWKYTAEAVHAWASRQYFIGWVVFEQPPAYRSDLPSRTLKLQGLLAVDAWICALHSGAEHVRYFPHEWKGGIKAEQCCARAEQRVEGPERALVALPAPSMAHNVWDAVGLGLKALGRFEPHRGIRRG